MSCLFRESYRFAFFVNVLVSRGNIFRIGYNCQLCLCTHLSIQRESSNYMLGELWKEFFVP